MKAFGALLCAAAIIALLVGFNFDTSVASSYGQRVNNIGLISDKQNIITLGGALLIAGALLLALSSRGPSQASQGGGAGYRKCPNCAEFVRDEAKSCRYCQHALPSLVEAAEQENTDRQRLAQAQASDADAAKALEDALPKGVCPNCEKVIPLVSLKCSHCKAIFGGGGWNVLPMPNGKQVA
jgi:hypothetical protein